MTKDQAKAILKTMKGLFPLITPEQSALLLETLLPYDAHRAAAVVKTHAVKHVFLDIPQLCEGLRSDEAGRRQKQLDSIADRIIDSVRRTAHQHNDHHFDGLDDPTVLFEHFSQAWESAKVITNEQARNSARSLIFAHAKTAFYQVGLSDEMVNEMARDCVDLGPMEKIITASMFPRKLLPPPSSASAMKDLAKASETAGAA